MLWVRRRQMSWLIWVQSELFFQLCRLWPFQSGTLLNDCNKHSSLLHFDDNQCHLNSRCGRNNLLRLVSIPLFWISIAYLTMSADCFFRLGPRIQAQRKGSFMILPLTFALWISEIKVCLYWRLPQPSWYCYMALLSGFQSAAGHWIMYTYTYRAHIFVSLSSEEK